LRKSSACSLNVIFLTHLWVASAFAESILRWRGIGWIEVSGPGRYTIRTQPKYRTDVPDIGLRGALTEEQKHIVPGNAESSFDSAFQRTSRRLRDAVNEEPGLTLKDVLGRVEHHYRSERHAQSALLGWLKAGRVRGVQAKYDGRRYRLYPVIEGGEDAGIGA